MLIEEEEQKMTAFSKYSTKGQTSLLKMKMDHRKAVEALTTAMQSKSTETINIKDVQKYCDQLISLKHTGGQFKQMMDTAILSKPKEFQYIEKNGLILN